MSTAKSPDRLAYPELDFGGFSRLDGTVAFYSRLNAMVETLARDAVILNIGCGRGKARDDQAIYRRNLQDLTRSSRRVIGIDVDPGGKENPFIHEFRPIGEDFRWPVDNASIDLALSDYVLEHVADPKSFFEEARRVLKPGGLIAIRTPNKHSYIALASMLVPNRLHGRVINRISGRKEEDVFPVVYRANTRRRLASLLRQSQFEPVVFAIEAEPGYLRFSRIAYRLGVHLHAWMPRPFMSTLLAFARKQG